VAVYQNDAKTAIELLRKSDEALYRAKIRRRNKVCLSTGERE
jgi:GGDEF domain-containing protein